MSITHAKVSAVPDGTDTSVVRPSDWNAAHSVSVLELPSGSVPTVPVPGSVIVFADYAAGSRIPVMTSATTPTGTASDSSHYDAPHAAWTAMPGTPSQGAGVGWLDNGGATPQWIQYQFTSGQTITSYSLRAWWTDNYPSRTPKDWTLDGSNDGTSWDTLDTVTGYTPVSSSAYVTFTVDTPGTYTYYRLNITANNGDTYIGVGGLYLYGQGTVVVLWAMNDDGTKTQIT
jgi:hypothetical protein